MGCRSSGSVRRGLHMVVRDGAPRASLQTRVRVRVSGCQQSGRRLRPRKREGERSPGSHCLFLHRQRGDVVDPGEGAANFVDLSCRATTCAVVGDDAVDDASDKWSATNNGKSTAGSDVADDEIDEWNAAGNDTDRAARCSANTERRSRSSSHREGYREPCQH